jgi:hypothetical protein
MKALDLSYFEREERAKSVNTNPTMLKTKYVFSKQSVKNPGPRQVRTLGSVEGGHLCYLM